MTRISRDAYGLKLAEAAALRADCTRRQVGAVIVAEDGSIVATGYNGLASGRPGCASAGACPRGQMAYPSEQPVKVGDPDTTSPVSGPWCKVYDPEDHFVCTLANNHGGGWHIAGDGTTTLNVWPTGETHPASVGYETTGCRAVHAEVNAIIRAGRDRCVGATIYITDEPCFHCSVVIEGAGLARVVWPTGEDERQVWSAPAPAPEVCSCPEVDPEKRAAVYTARLGTEPHAVGCPRWGMEAEPTTPHAEPPEPEWLAALRRQQDYHLRHSSGGLAEAMDGPQ